MRGLAESTITLALYAYKLLAELHPMTLRQLHYAIFSKAEINYQNDKASYRKLSNVTSMSRRLSRALELDEGDDDDVRWIRRLGMKNLIPHDWIVDETRLPHMVSVFENAAEYVDVIKRAYRRDAWQTQPNYVEIWSEKGTVLGSIRPVADELGVMVRVAHGFASCGMEGQIGEAFERIGKSKKITIFFLGDHDPSGHVIEEDIHQRAETACGREFEMVRLAIHPEDIKLFNLPPQRIKETDTRSAGFKRRFGKKAPTIELDALPVDQLRHRVKTAVTRLIDQDLWQQQLSTEEAEFNCIQEFAAKIKSLPQSLPEYESANGTVNTAEVNGSDVNASPRRRKRTRTKTPQPDSYVVVSASAKRVIAERIKHGESQAQVAADYSITPGKVSQICAKLAKRQPERA